MLTYRSIVGKLVCSLKLSFDRISVGFSFNKKRKQVHLVVLCLIAMALSLVSNQAAIADTSSTLGTTGRSPFGVTMDSAGNIYTANFLDSTVSKITPQGVSSIFGTTGSGPFGIAIDPAGNIYTANVRGNNVSKITPGGVSSILGTTGHGPVWVALDSDGNVYTANNSDHSVSKITPTGVSVTLTINGRYPYGIAVDSVGNVYVASLENNNVSKITPAGVSSILGTTGDRPIGLTIDSAGNVYTANTGSNNVSKITPAGVSSILGTTGAGPYGIVLDSAGNVYTANTGSNNVSKITPQGVSRILGTTGSAPNGIFIDSAGNIYTANENSNNVSKITISVAAISAGSVPNSQVATIPSGVTVVNFPATAALPATSLNFGGTVPTAVTVVPLESNPAPASATPFTITSSTKIVDIQILGTFTDSATVCLDGAPTEHLFHYTGGAWIELSSQTHTNGQACGVTTSFSPFTSAEPAVIPDEVQASPEEIAKAAAESVAATAKAAAEARARAVEVAKTEIKNVLSSGKPLTADQLLRADFNGVTTKNIGLVNSDIAKLSDSDKTDLKQIEKVVLKFATVDKLAEGKTVYSSDLIAVGLIPQDSKIKSSITSALKKLPGSTLDSFEKIQAEIASVEKVHADRKARLAAILGKKKR